MSGPTTPGPAGFAGLRPLVPGARRAGAADGPGPGGIPVDPLQRIARRRRELPRPGERCEMCDEAIGPGHGHVADLEGHRLLCTCRGCYLLFTGRGAGGLRYRAVPTAVRRVPGLTLTAAQWDALQVPVDLAFFFRQSGVGHVVCCYPGPGGATESTLALGAWAEVEELHPAMREVAVDVEAVLVRRHDGGDECFIVPIDVCYELVGLVRSHWNGFAGGAEVWARIGEFFERLHGRSTDVGAG